MKRGSNNEQILWFPGNALATVSTFLVCKLKVANAVAKAVCNTVANAVAKAVCNTVANAASRFLICHTQSDLQHLLIAMHTRAHAHSRDSGSDMSRVFLIGKQIVCTLSGLLNTMYTKLLN